MAADGRGAPLGNRNAAKGSVWRNAINRALEHRSRAKQVAALDEIAEKLLAACDAGDVSALRELGDRLDGKPAQAVILHGDADEPPINMRATVELIHARPVSDTGGT